MTPIGDCLTCTKLSSCSETSVERVLISYTCPLYEPVIEAVFRARVDMMQRYGEVIAIEAMLQKPNTFEEEDL